MTKPSIRQTADGTPSAAHAVFNFNLPFRNSRNN